jgi:hypothetical protein
MWVSSACKTCRDLGGDLLKIMSAHMKAQQEVCDAAFVSKNPTVAHNAEIRARVLMRESNEKRATINAHRQIDHSDNKLDIADVVL